MKKENEKMIKTDEINYPYNTIKCIKGYDKLDQVDRFTVDSYISNAKYAIERLRGRAIGYIIDTVSEIENCIVDSSLIHQDAGGDIISSENSDFLNDLSRVFERLSSIASDMELVCTQLERYKIDDITNFAKECVEADEKS